MGKNHCRRCHKNITKTELPYDVLFNNILTRLPATTLIRFLNVSKQWYSSLKSPIFANMHLNYVTNDDHQNHHKLLLLSVYGACELRTIDCETLDLSTCHPCPFKVSPGNIWIISSCNGLILAALNKDDHDMPILMFSDLILWNPLTGDYRKLAKTNYNEDYYNVRDSVFHLYYNSSEKDYTLLRLTAGNQDVYIYSLKSDSWRKVDPKDAFQCLPNLLIDGFGESTCLNENLYFLIYGNEYLYHIIKKKYHIIRFDTKAQKFTEMATPFIGNRMCSGLVVQRGCLYSCVKYSTTNSNVNDIIELWKMNEDEVWMKVLTYTHKEEANRFLKPLYLMRNGNWLIKSHNSGYLYKVEMEKKHGKCKVHLNNLNGFFEEGGYIEASYIETFVSPNHYMN